MFLTAIYILVAYLIGSICSAVIVCNMFDLPDPRTNGSENPGATNVLRLAGKSYAIIVLVADMLKGLLPVLLAKMLGAGPIALGFVCLAAVVGHVYPIYFHFKGGKGVATAIGALLGFHFILGVMVIATWLIVARLTRYSSLASILSILFAPFYSLFAVGSIDTFLPLFFITLLITYQHRNNIVRLMDGEESKINVTGSGTLDMAASQSLPVKKLKPTKPVKKSKAMKEKKTTTKKK